MERKFLEGLGLEKEAIDKVLDQNGSEITVLKSQITTKDTTIQQLRDDVIDKDGRLATLEKVDVEDLQRQLDDEKAGREKDLKTFNLKALLSKEGCSDLEYLLYKLGESVEFEEDGTIKDVENFVKSTKETYAAQFQEESAGGTGGAGNFRRDHNEPPKDTSKMTYSELSAYMSEHPDAKID